MRVALFLVCMRPLRDASMCLVAAATEGYSRLEGLISFGLLSSGM